MSGWAVRGMGGRERQTPSSHEARRGLIGKEGAGVVSDHPWVSVAVEADRWRWGLGAGGAGENAPRGPGGPRDPHDPPQAPERHARLPGHDDRGARALRGSLVREPFRGDARHGRPAAGGSCPAVLTRPLSRPLSHMMRPAEFQLGGSRQHKPANLHERSLAPWPSLPFPPSPPPPDRTGLPGEASPIPPAAPTSSCLWTSSTSTTRSSAGHPAPGTCRPSPTPGTRTSTPTW